LVAAFSLLPLAVDSVREEVHHGLAEMRDNQSSGRERKLVHVPIIHTRADMGALGASIQSAKLSALGRQGLARSAAVVERVWTEIERAVGNLPVTPGSVRVYQDGLPVCGHEQEIVKELAEAGSRNHRLLLNLQSRGAVLMGTESPDLLVEEYQLASAALAAGRASPATLRRDRLPDTLLARRDSFIADRINRTLGSAETGILFLGMLHEVTKSLDPDIRVVTIVRL
jgi:hypothetical protein